MPTGIHILECIKSSPRPGIEGLCSSHLGGALAQPHQNPVLALPFRLLLFCSLFVLLLLGIQQRLRTDMMPYRRLSVPEYTLSTYPLLVIEEIDVLGGGRARALDPRDLPGSLPRPHPKQVRARLCVL